MTPSLWRPGRLRPMLAGRAAGPFDSGDHVYEIKWDGYRCLAFIDGTVSPPGVYLQSRNGHDLTPLFPELHHIHHTIKHRVILDGEVVVAPGDVASFSRLQQRVRRRAGTSRHPVSFVAFDLLYRDGQDLTQEPYFRRRRRLEEIFGPGTENWALSPVWTGTGTRLFRSVVARGFEGLVAKDRKSPYTPGVRSRHWLKIVNRRTGSFVIGGASPGKIYGIGGLLLGLFEPGGKRLRYMGKVSSGLDRQAIIQLAQRLQGSEDCPFTVPPPGQGIVWVKPSTVCDVSYLDLTREGLLRQPVYSGLRDDVAPEECRWRAGGGVDQD